MKPPPPYLCLKAEAKGFEFEAGLNEIPLVTDYWAAGTDVQFCVNEFLDTKNAIFVNAAWPSGENPPVEEEDADEPAEAPDAEKGFGFHVSLFLVDPNQLTPTPVKTLASVNFPPLPGDRYIPSFSERKCELRLPIDLSVLDKAPPISPFWKTAKELPDELTEIQQKVLLTRVEELRTAVMSRDQQSLHKILAFRTTDSAIALGHDPAEKLQILNEQLEGPLSDDEEMSSKPLEEKLAEFRICGNKKLVLVQRLGFVKPAVFVELASYAVGFETYFGLVDDAWTLVR